MPKKIEFNEFIIRTQAKFNNRFALLNMYSGDFNYNKSADFICYIHGVFRAVPKQFLLSKHGCNHCRDLSLSKNYRLSLNEFIKQSKRIHGIRYDYSKVIYTNAHTKVKINCPIHGIFLQRPLSHKKRGCPTCNGGIPLTKSEFIKHATSKHGTQFDYSTIYNWRGLNHPVSIICNQHGPFTLSKAEKHKLQKHGGCKKCAKFGADQNLWLKSLNVSTKLYQKKVILYDGSYIIADAFDPSSNTVYEYWGDYHHGHPSYIRSTRDNHVSGLTHQERYVLTLEKISKIRGSKFILIDIWEHEWIQNNALES